MPLRDVPISLSSRSLIELSSTMAACRSRHRRKVDQQRHKLATGRRVHDGMGMSRGVAGTALIAVGSVFMIASSALIWRRRHRVPGARKLGESLEVFLRFSGFAAETALPSGKPAFRRQPNWHEAGLYRSRSISWRYRSNGESR